jgi:YD repeat-containing protein
VEWSFTFGEFQGHTTKLLSFGSYYNADAVLQESYTYDTYTYQSPNAGSQTIYVLASDTVYANSDGTGAEATSYTYTWYANSPQEKTVVTTLPVVSTTQNGSGLTAQTVDFYDSEGNLTWSQDADGYLTLNQYDATTGLLMETVQNVNTSSLPPAIANPADPVAVPDYPNTSTPVATPAGDTSNLNATTDYAYDPEGRLTQTLGPVHTADVGGTATSVRTATWNYYDDADHEYLTAQGYATQDGSGGWTVFTAVDPVSIEVTNPDGQETNDIQASMESALGLTADTDAVGDISLSEADLSPSAALAEMAAMQATLSQSTPLLQPYYTAWTTYQYSHKQLVSTRVYYAIPASGAGTATVNYNETQYGYNAVGNPEWTETPAGTITWDVLDAQDQTMSTWEGTNDTDSTATDPTGGTTGQAAGNNMVEVASYVYDADGDVTSMTECPDSNSADDRTTTYGYDWRELQTYVVNPPDAEGDVSYTMTTYDNLGEATETQTYLYQGSELAAALADATADPPAKLNSADVLLAQSSTSYDSLGQVYQSSDYLVAGGVAGTAETTNYWHDANGNETALTDPDNNQTTWQYDGLGNMVLQTNPIDVSADVPATDQYDYDAAGELVQSIDGDGRAITYSYDGIGRETGENWYGSVDSSGVPQGSATETISYTYNSAGLLYTASDANATYTYTYLCPCQLAGVDFFRAAVLFSPGREKRVGGAGGGASSPCSPARGGRKRRTLRTTGAGDWQDACPRGAKVGALGGRWQDTVEVRFLLAS